ncbi:UNVERIFIED_CONTAM: putative mitochondrial protein [Sesamum latifolium]|uniref:Mitochondrial protein n=1 Tax=Sesamum latifolium TaxID=2727402 RepID=A0AAW2WBS4_9LAMI
MGRSCLVQPSKGLRQGDPLSPYLFLFYAEVLSALVNQAKKRGELKGVSMSQYTSRISNLLFADTLIFCQAMREVMACIKRILETMECTSGLKINLDKTAMVFSKNVTQATRESLAAVLGMAVVERHAKCLGLPTIVDYYKRLRECLPTSFSTPSWKPRSIGLLGRDCLEIKRGTGLLPFERTQQSFSG